MTKYKVSIEITVHANTEIKSDISQDIQAGILSFLGICRTRMQEYSNTAGDKIIGYSVHTKQCQKPLEVKL